MRNTALIYARLSGVEGDELSPSLQIKKCESLAHTLTLSHNPQTDIYADDTPGLHSAHKRINIPQWYKLLERCKTDDSVAAVLVYDHARAFRSVQAMLLETESLNRYGVKLIRVRGGEVDLQSADGRRRAIDDANAAEYHSRKTSELLRDHYTELKEQKIYFAHRAPLGLTRTGSINQGNLKWTANLDLQIIITILNLYLQHKGESRVAFELAELGVHPRGRRPTDALVRSVITTVEKYEPFIHPLLYARVIRERGLRENRRSNSRVLTHPPLLLRRLITCGDCKMRWHVAHSVRAYDRIEPSYIHPSTVPCNNPCRWINADKVHNQLWEQLDVIYKIVERTRTIIEQHLDEQIPVAPPKQLDYEQKKAKLNARLDGYYKEWADGDMGTDRERYLHLVSQTRKELDDLEPPKEIPPSPQLDRAMLRFLLDHPLDSLREASEVNPQAGNELLINLVESLTIFDGILTVTVKPSILKFVQ